MRADDPKLKRLEPPRLKPWEKFFLPQIAVGLGVTAQHIAGVMFANKAITVQYPEEQHVPSPNYRGVHRLNKDEQGRVKCVACMLCATACPAHCIDIVGATAPPTWPDREKYPESFVIDELRCIYCGMCEEACPVEAIELTGLYDLTGLAREEMIFDKTKLLSVFDLTKDQEPMRYGKPPVEHASDNQDLAVVPEVKEMPTMSILSALILVLCAAAARHLLLLPHRHGAAQPRLAVHSRRDHGGRGVCWPFWRSLTPPGPFLPTVFFYIFSATALDRRFLTVTSRNPIYSALWFASVVLSTSGLFLLASAPFLAAGTIIVYAGAIIVTFLFVIMLAQMEGKALYDRAARAPGTATFTCFLLLWCLIYSLSALTTDAVRAGSGTRRPLSRTRDMPKAYYFAALERVARRPRPGLPVDLVALRLERKREAERRRAGRSALYRSPGHCRAHRRLAVRRACRGRRHRSIPNGSNARPVTHVTSNAQIADFRRRPR